MQASPIILVPGFWLGAWAWDPVTAILRPQGYRVRALTLPGLETVEANRSAVSLTSHIDAICDALWQAGEPAVLAVHSAAGFAGYAASDRMPERIRAMIYVDTAPGKGALNPAFDAVDYPLPSWEDMDPEDIALLNPDERHLLRDRAVPEPGALLREAAQLTNAQRQDIPSIVICTSRPQEEIKALAHQGYSFLAGLPELHHVVYIDLPTHHWPMWSRPDDIAQILAKAAHGYLPR
ncbi:MAG: alpha/beta hydrolase [Sulfobacillus benefaciens]|uniref:Alpha/beta hydrolase n=1 Tax=Sulfobacillus benefaciens TaxID=453960 RepID=A0A2T2XDY2_9FIRM|nr:MAG: alpha/beta hydrolase [Sulfobacillus benefaciens]